MAVDSGSIASRILASTPTYSCQHERVATGSIATLVRADVSITWDTAFADTNYTVILAVEDTSALGLGLTPERIRSKTTSGITVQVFNASLGSLSGTLHAVAIHD